MDWSPQLETIQVVLDRNLLEAADRAAKRARINRSALIREALSLHLQRLHILELEEKDRRGYRSRPARDEESSSWEEVAAWPVP